MVADGGTSPARFAGRGELRAVLRVRIVEQQGLVVYGRAVRLARRRRGSGPSGVAPSPACDLSAIQLNPRSTRRCARARPSDEERQRVGFLGHDDGGAPFAAGPGDGLVAPAAPAGQRLGVGVARGHCGRVVAHLRGEFGGLPGADRGRAEVAGRS